MEFPLLLTQSDTQSARVLWSARCRQVIVSPGDHPLTYEPEGSWYEMSVNIVHFIQIP